METWKNVPGYEGVYLVSDLGRIKSLKWGKTRLMKPKFNRFGYPLISFSRRNKQKTFKIHRLVMLTFVGPSELCVNHKDFNRKNNSLKNLEYVTYKQNNKHMRDSGRVNWARGQRVANAKLSDADRANMKLLRGAISCVELGKIFGVKHSTISKAWRS